MLSLNIHAQMHACGDKLIEHVQKTNLRQYDTLVQNMNRSIRDYINRQGNSVNGRSLSVASVTGYTIPVVFHVVHPTGQAYGSGANISYQQILSQLDALNAAFSKNYPAYNGQTHASYAQNTDIRFCLASVAMPASVTFYNGPGGIEKGVMRYADNAATDHYITNASATTLMGLTHPTPAHFPFSNYLNIWIVSSIGGNSAGTVMGYAPKPLMSAYPLDGIVMRSDVVGDNSTGNTYNLGFGLQQGKVLVHEMGHYLNLMHIFEGGCAGANAAGSGSDPCDLNGDMICDIEPSTTQNIACNLPVPNTCTANYATGTTTSDMIEDYMSYADDDCMNTFTNGQKLRMQATLNNLRTNLWQFNNLTATGVIGPNGCSASILYVNINKPQINFCTNTSIALSNATSGNTATSWNWTFAGGSPATATSNSVSVTYTAPGLYYAKLRVSNGSSFVTDSVALAVTSCSLDPKKLDRSNWLFGDSCSISFASGSPIPNNLVKQHQTIACAEMAVSMSDSLGNLLFYSDGVNLWDDTHTIINTSPLFGWDLKAMGGYRFGTSVGGFMAFRMPKQKNKYAIICVPPAEIRYSAQNNFAKISCVVYDVVTKTVSPYQSLSSSLVNGTNNSFLTEDLCVVPHCNGVDYWVITRAYINNTTGVFYSFLFNQNGLNPNATPVVSGTFNKPLGTSGIKSNSTGTKLICNSGASSYFLYDFNATTGIVSNEVAVPVTLPIQANSCCAAIFSPNDAYLYMVYGASPDNFIQQVAVNTMSVVNTLTSVDMNYSPMVPSYMEVGPDNTIYFTARNGWYMGSISNPDSPTPSLGSAPVISPFQAQTGAVLSLLNYIEADRPAEINPFMMQQTGCSSFSYSLSPCWNIYTASWNFGDGSPVANGTSVSHTYSNAGIYTVSLTLSYNGQSIPAYTRTIGVTGSSPVISGPGAICKGNTYLNNYSTTNVSGATYNWMASNASISGPSNLPSVNLLSANTGVATLTLQVTNGGCNATSTKVITIDTLPQVALTASTLTCIGNTVALNGIPAGGSYTGTNVAAAAFSPTATGVHKVYYTYANTNNCSNTASLSITVNACTGIEETDPTNGGFGLFPNPTSDEVFVSSSAPILKVEIFNPMGQVVMLKTDIHKVNAVVELGHLAQGMYYVQVYTDKGTMIRKVIKK